MVVHLTAAPHKEALGDVLAAVTAAACQIQFFQHMNVLALHLSVADKIESGGKTRESRTDYISRFFIDILRLLRVCKRFIGSC